MANPFDFVASVSDTKIDLLKQEGYREEDYVPYLTNKALSYHPDSILYANDMNMFANLPKVAQYSYFINSLRPRKRFSKWAKPVESELLNAVQDILKMNIKDAADVLTILSEEQKEQIRQAYLSKGGVK